MFDVKRLAQLFKEKATELTRNKKYDIHEPQSYRSEEGEMVGDKSGKWDGNQPEAIHMRDSSAIADVKYNPKTGDCKVKFVGGNKYYTYPNVPAEAVQDWKGQASKGRYFNAAIKPYSINQ